MRKSLFVKSLSLAALLLSSQVFAASTSFEDPATASWGGWNRGDVGTTYAHWEVFDNTSLPLDNTPDAGLSGAVVNNHVTNHTTAFIVGDNIYSFSEVADFTNTIQKDAFTPGPVTVALQLATRGNLLDLSSIVLGIGGVETLYDSATLLFEDSLGSQGDINEYLFLWTLASDIVFYQFDFNSVSSSLSLDAISVDIGPAAVPVPAAVWLFGSALLGLVGVRRRPALVA